MLACTLLDDASSWCPRLPHPAVAAHGCHAGITLQAVPLTCLQEQGPLLDGGGGGRCGRGCGRRRSAAAAGALCRQRSDDGRRCGAAAQQLTPAQGCRGRTAACHGAGGARGGGTARRRRRRAAAPSTTGRGSRCAHCLCGGVWLPRAARERCGQQPGRKTSNCRSGPQRWGVGQGATPMPRTARQRARRASGPLAPPSAPAGPPAGHMPHGANSSLRRAIGTPALINCGWTSRGQQRGRPVCRRALGARRARLGLPVCLPWIPATPRH